MRDILSIAIKSSEKAAEALSHYFEELKESEISLKGRNDYVTKADKLSERIIVETIKHYFPDHSIIAEESGRYAGNEWKWYIDPLDGTKNFIHGLPMFCVSIAVEYRSTLTASVINAPVISETFFAEKGGGAWCNNRRIKVSSKSFEEALIATGFPFRGKELLDVYLKSFREIFSIASGVRRCGSAALDLAYTAKGVFDGFWEMHLHSWDIAAGALLVTEADGIVSDFKGKDKYLETGNIIGCSKIIYEDFFSIIRKHLEYV